MSSLYLPVPKYFEPKQLSALAGRFEGRSRAEDFKAVEFPLKKIEEIFQVFGESGSEEIRLIDLCRLAMALVSNLETLLEGKRERHPELCDYWLPKKKFSESLLDGIKTKKIFWVYLQKLFLRHEIVKAPHLQLMDNFFRVAKNDTALPMPIAALLRIKKNKVEFITESAKNCLDLRKSPARYWDNLNLIADEFVEKEYIQKIEDKVIDRIITSPKELDAGTIQKFLTLILDFNDRNSRLTFNLEKLIFGAEKSEVLQEAAIAHVEKNLKVPPNWDLVPGISSLAIKSFEKLLGLVEFQYFELVAEIIHDQFLQKDQSEKNRLRNRTFFWMNYRDQISSIKIFLNTESAKKFRGNFSAYHAKFSVSERLLDNIGTTDFDSEIVLILLKDLLVVEFFRGSSHKTILIRSGNKFYPRLSKSDKLRRDVIRELEETADFRVHHGYLWQKALMNFLAEKIKIQVSLSHIIIPKQGTFKSSGRISKTVVMNKSDYKIHENYADYNDLLDRTIQGHRKKIDKQVFVSRSIK